MKQTFLLIIFISLGFSTVFAQIDFEDIKINELFRLEVDSFEIRNINNKGHQYTNYFLHYTVTNISDDTLVFSTNGCPSYNQYIFEMNDTIYRPNKWVRCISQDGRVYYLFPNQSITKEEVMNDDFSFLAPEMTKLKLTIPGDVRRPLGFSIDGRGFNKKIANLIFEGDVLIVENKAIVLSEREKRLAIYEKLDCEGMKTQFELDKKNGTIVYFECSSILYEDLDKIFKEKYNIECYYSIDIRYANMACYDDLVKSYIKEKYDEDLDDY